MPRPGRPGRLLRALPEQRPPDWVCDMHIGRTVGAVPRTIQIRNVPDEVHRTLRTRAAAAGMSLSDYLLGEIEQVASRPAISDFLRRAGERGGGVSREAIVEAVRAGRDRSAQIAGHRHVGGDLRRPCVPPAP